MTRPMLRQFVEISSWLSCVLTTTSSRYQARSPEYGTRLADENPHGLKEGKKGATNFKISSETPVGLLRMLSPQNREVLIEARVRGLAGDGIGETVDDPMRGVISPLIRIGKDEPGPLARSPGGCGEKHAWCTHALINSVKIVGRGARGVWIQIVRSDGVFWMLGDSETRRSVSCERTA